MSKRRLAARLCVIPMAAALGLANIGVASAHVTISPTTAAAGSYTVLTVSVPHGCEGSPTTKVAIRIPERIESVTPTRNALWDVRKVMTQLDQPVTDAHGKTVTERVGKIVYTAEKPLPPGQRAEFELSVKLPDTPGKTLVFPTVQTCQEGETAWVQVPASGQSAHQLAHPAPTVTVLPAGSESGSSHGNGSGTQSSSADTSPAASGSDVSSPGALAITGLIVAVLGLALAAAAFVRTRRQQ